MNKNTQHTVNWLYFLNNKGFADGDKSEDDKGSGDSKPDMSDYVSKADLSKMQGELSNLKTELEKANMQLLDPDYLAYRSGKKDKGTGDDSPPKKSSQSSDPGLEEIRQQNERLEKELKSAQQAVSNLYYQQELRDTKERFSDFDEYKDDIQSFLKKTNGNYTYEDAYILVKEQRRREKGDDDSSKKTTKQRDTFSEKPNKTAAATGMEPKEYKSEEEATKATLQALREKYPDLGDSL